MGRMTEITQGYGDAATFPTWAKHPELDVSSDETETFTFTSKVGCQYFQVTVIAKMYCDTGECAEIKRIYPIGANLDISGYLETSVHEELAKLAETKFHARAEEDAA